MKLYLTIFIITIIFYHKSSHFSLNYQLFFRNNRLQTTEKSLLFRDKKP